MKKAIIAVVAALSCAACVVTRALAAAVKKAYPRLLGTGTQDLHTGTKFPLTVFALTNDHLSGISLRSVELG